MKIEIKPGYTFTYTQLCGFGPDVIRYVYEVEIVKVNKKTVRYTMKEKNWYKTEYTESIEKFLARYGDLIK